MCKWPVYLLSMMIFHLPVNGNSVETYFAKQEDLNNHALTSNRFTLLKDSTLFSHLSAKEFEEIYLSDYISTDNSSYKVKPATVSELQKSVKLKKIDWRTHLNFSTVSPVKNQKKCGGCWAFSTVETVESMFSIATNKPPPTLSVQEVIDCSYNNFGCQGGNTCMAAKWLKDSKYPVVSDTVYPLTDESNPCKIVSNTTMGPKVVLKNYACYNFAKNNSEELILKLLNKGPVAAAVDARTWMNYQGGIIQYHCETNVNHAIQIVGYDLTGDVPYYIVRNSWGTEFGHGGYLYIRAGANVCGIAQQIVALEVFV